MSKCHVVLTEQSSHRYYFVQPCDGISYETKYIQYISTDRDSTAKTAPPGTV